jgi:uncharacterized protein
VRKKIIKINDPIHGFIIFPEFITMIVDSKEMQRLTRIRQLSGANYVFPGANHTRFEHSLGVAALAQRLVNNLKDLQGVDLDEEDVNDCLVAALCHDIGHGPFSHNFESILMENKQKDHEDFTEWIINKSALGDTLDDLGFNREFISKVATGRILSQGNAKGSLISQVITSAVNVDSMDYLLRDNYHCGTEGRSVDINRLLLSVDEYAEGMLGVDIKALIALEGFLLSRISSFRTIYFHKTCRAVQLMLTEAMKSAANDIGLLDFKTPDDYTAWDDYVLWTKLLENKKSNDMIEKIKNRHILKMCYESQAEISKLKINIAEVREELSKATGIPIGEIYIDLPSSSNVPYSHADQTRPVEIYSFSRMADGTKIPVRLEDKSIFFNQFRGHLKLIRVYTWNENRKKLSKAALKILGKPS